MVFTTLKNKVIIVTGATSGIGYDASLELAKQGAKLVLAGRREANGKKLVEAIVSAGGTAAFKQTDVSSEEQTSALVAFAVEQFGQVDAIWLNAGVLGAPTPVGTQDVIANYDHLFSVNVRPVVAGIAAAAPFLAKASEGSAIIATSSIMSVVAMPGFASYGASKAAVDAIVRYAAEDLKEQGTDVYSINPYVFVSEMSHGASGGNPDAFAANVNPSGKAGRGEEVGAVIADLLLGKLGDKYKTGANIALDAEQDHYDVLQVPAKMAAAAASKSA